MPRLADRRSDIPILIEFFLDRFRIAGMTRKHLSPEAIQLMMSYHWPGNVRELANMVEGLILLAPGAEIRAEDLPPALRPKVKLQLEDSATPLPMIEVERLHILHTMRYTEGKKPPPRASWASTSRRSTARSSRTGSSRGGGARSGIGPIGRI